MENKKLRQISADYTRVKRVFGPEQVAAAVEADKQREQAEKARKRPRRSLDRDGRQKSRFVHGLCYTFLNNRATNSYLQGTETFNFTDCKFYEFVL